MNKVLFDYGENSNLIVTSHIDSTVRIWDTRYLGNTTASPLFAFEGLDQDIRHIDLDK